MGTARQSVEIYSNLLKIRSTADKVTDFDVAETDTEVSAAKGRPRVTQGLYSEIRRSLEVLLGRYPEAELKLSLSPAIMIGSGGSVGSEGPIVQIGSAFSSTLGSLIPMRTSDRISLIAAGTGTRIAATFNTFLGGIVFAFKLLLVSVNARYLLLGTTTVLASYIGRLLLGTGATKCAVSTQD